MAAPTAFMATIWGIDMSLARVVAVVVVDEEEALVGKKGKNTSSSSSSSRVLVCVDDSCVGVSRVKLGNKETKFEGPAASWSVAGLIRVGELVRVNIA